MTYTPASAGCEGAWAPGHQAGCAPVPARPISAISGVEAYVVMAFGYQRDLKIGAKFWPNRQERIAEIVRKPSVQQCGCRSSISATAAHVVAEITSVTGSELRRPAERYQLCCSGNAPFLR